jgi:hypothetical protein
MYGGRALIMLILAPSSGQGFAAVCQSLCKISGSVRSHRPAQSMTQVITESRQKEACNS